MKTYILLRPALNPFSQLSQKRAAVLAARKRFCLAMPGGLLAGFLLAANVALGDSYSVDITAQQANAICNQLDHGSNRLSEVIQAPPDGTVLYKYDNSNATWSAASYSAAGGVWTPNLTLQPGEGAFLRSPSNFTITFTGTPHVPVLPPCPPCTYPSAIYFLGRQTNDVGNYDSITGFSPSNDVAVYKWNGTNYDAFTFTSNAWSPSEPGFAVGEAVWIAGQTNLIPPPIPVSYNVNVHPGLNLICNQLDHGSNRLDEIAPGLPDGSIFYKYNNGSGTWSAAAYTAAGGFWTPGNITLQPGEGAFLQSPSNFSITFTGTPHVPVLPVTIPAGATYLLSRQTNDLGTYQTITGLSPSNGVKVYKWTGSSYMTFSFSSGVWSPSQPTNAVGEAVWISRTGNLPVALPGNYPLNVPTGMSLIANQLDHGSNTLNEIAPGVPDGCIIYKYSNSNATWSASTYSAASGSWNPANLTLKPGEGAFLQSPTNFNCILVGNPHVPVLPVTIPNGVSYLLSRQTNDIGTYPNITGFSPTNGVSAYKWTGSNYNTFTFSSGFWSPSEPSNAVGEASWFSRSGISPPSLNPSITVTQDPQSLVVTQGSMAVFTVQVSSMLGVTYQWRFNGFNILGATNGTYIIPSASATDAGAYDVVVYNGASAKTSGAGTLSVQPYSAQCCDSKGWEQEPILGDTPSARYGHAMCAAPLASLVMFGGFDASATASPETWLWNGISWLNVTAPPWATGQPEARGNHAMAYDSDHNQAVMFGGWDGSTLAAATTWLWDGTKWNANNVSGPPARRGHAMAFDPENHNVVLFGGADAGGTLITDGVWLWDGQNWSHVTPPGPMPRQGHAMVFDSNRHRVVLYGGDTGGGNLSNETWEWDGASWSGPMSGLSFARAGVAMVYDEDCARIYLFGGRTSGATYSETWKRDGTAWSSVSAFGPSARADLSGAYLAAREQIVIFDGNLNAPPNPANPVSDTWALVYNPNSVNNGSFNAGLAYHTAERLWSRELDTKRFSWRKVGDLVGKGDHSFDYFAFVSTDFANTYNGGIYPSSGIYKQRRSKNKCNDDFTDCLGCLSGCLPFHSDCRWHDEHAKIFFDYSLGADFCNPVEVSLQFHDYDRPWKDAALATLTGVLSTVGCIGTIVAAEVDWWAIYSTCGAAVLDDIAAFNAIKNSVNSVPNQNSRLVGELSANGVDSDYFTSPTPPGNTTHYISCREDRYDTESAATSHRLSNTIHHKEARVETQWEFQSYGQGISSCTQTVCAASSSNVCTIRCFEYAQLSGGDLRFKIDVAGPALNQVSQVLGGSREFIVAIDADNNVATGDQCPPFCGADYYVSILQLPSADNQSVVTSNRIYKWNPCLAPYAPCQSSGDWQLQVPRPYNVNIRQTTLDGLVSLQDVGDPQGYFCAWAISRTSNYTNNAPYTNLICNTAPGNPCAQRMQIGREPDTNCPTVVKYDYLGVTAGNHLTPITVTFSEAMHAISASDITIDPFQPYTVSLDPVSRAVLSITPLSPWKAGHYTVTLLPSITDYSGNALAGTVDGDGNKVCGSPYSFDFCVSDLDFHVTDGSGTDKQEFLQGEHVFVKGSGFTHDTTFQLYLVLRDNVDEPGKALADWTDTGVETVTVDHNGVLALTDLGVPALPASYKVVADLNNNGMYDTNDRVYDLCGAGLLYGDTNSCKSTLDDIVAWWPFDEASPLGPVNELIEANHGTVFGTSSLVAGEVGKARGFDGTTTYVAVPDDSATLDPSLNFGTGDFSIELWVNPSAFNAERPLVDKRTPGPAFNFEGYYLYLAGGTLSFQLGDPNGPGIQTFARQDSLPNGWSHVAVTVTEPYLDNNNVAQPGVIMLYLNGSGYQAGTIPFGSGFNVDNTAELRMGANRAGDVNTLFYAGLMDEVTMYDRALTPSEVQFIYSQGSQGKCTDAVLASVVAQPSGRSVLFGGSATLAVSASSAYPLTYQWFRNGVKLVDSTNVFGSTSSSLVLSNIDLALVGQYTVEIANFAGGVLSSAATVSIETPPALISPSVTNRNFQFTLSGDAGHNYLIQVSSNLTAWNPLATISNATGQVTFTETNALTRNVRFYRALVLP